MSRLIDKLTKATRATASPMGFRTARADREKPKLLLIASVPPDNTGRIGGYVAGADAVWLRAAGARLSVKAIQPAVASLAGIPCGVSLEEAGTGNTRALIKAGCDFLVFDDKSPVESAPIEDEAIGKILKIASPLEDSLIRAINYLPVDAVLAGDGGKENGPLAWHDIMGLQRLGLLLNKPLLAAVSPAISPGELKAIWEADVDGLVIEADPDQPDLFKEMQKTVSELPPRTGKLGKPEALLPATGSAPPAVPPDEEEEEEYE